MYSTDLPENQTTYLGMRRIDPIIELGFSVFGSWFGALQLSIVAKKTLLKDVSGFSLVIILTNKPIQSDMFIVLPRLFQGRFR
jgi:hypothetical protein